MKRILKIVLAEMLVFTCILSAVRPVFAATDGQLKGEIIAYFSASAPSVPWGQDPGPLWENTGHTDADVERKLQELEKQNPEEGAKWRKIIDFWYEANSEGFTNEYHPIKNEEGEYVINTEEMVTTFPNDNSLCFFGYGNRMQNDGSMSAENVGRCETLLALSQQYPNAYIMLSGGHTAGAQFDSEAGAMFNWLKAHGVAADRMILDEEAMNTVGNITNSMKHLANYPQIKKFVAVTSSYHIPRASLFLMTYIYANGLDETRGYEFAGNIGYFIEKNESVAMQASGVGDCAGVARTDIPRTVTVSQLASIVPVLKATQIKKGTELSTIIDEVYATFTNTDENQDVSNFQFDITDKANVTGYDKDKLGKQTVTFSWEYPAGNVKSADVTVEVVEKTDSQLKGEIIAYFSASAPSVPWGQDPGPLWENTGHTDADVERKLQELEKQNPEEGAKWRKIIDFWYEANSEGFTNEYHPIKNEEGEYVINTEEMVTTFPNDNSLCFFGYGNRMQNDGSMSAENVGRCETLLALAQQYPNAYIMLSGGHTAGAQFDSEAGAMFNWLKAHGVAKDRMILDEEALNTVGNITNSMKHLVDYPQIKKFVAVTSSYHIPRASLFLMTYIYANGLDETRGYEYAGNIGYFIEKNESVAMQASGVGDCAGVARADIPRTVTVSDPKAITVTGLQNGLELPYGTDISELITGVKATYTNTNPDQKTDGFSFDVTDQIEISGYDPETSGEQSVTVSYTYNKKTVFVTYNVTVKEQVPVYTAEDEEPEYTSGSGAFSLIVHRSYDDEKTFELYDCILMDDDPIPAEYVTATSGSLNAVISADYMNDLAVGNHEIVVKFTDGTARIELKVNPNPDELPDTGDIRMSGAYRLSAVMSLLMLAVLSRKRKED